MDGGTHQGCGVEIPRSSEIPAPADGFTPLRAPETPLRTAPFARNVELRPPEDNAERNQRMSSGDELVELLLRRHDVLRAVREEPRERHVLVDDLDQSKSTVYKALSQLQERGLVRETSRGLRPTQFGIAALERFDELAGTRALGDLLADLPPGTVDPAALVGAEAVVPDRQSVDRHLARLERLFREADSIRGFSPAISPEQSSMFHERTVDEDLAADLVIPSQLVDHIHRVDPDGFAEAVAADGVTFYRADEEPRISLFLTSSPAGTEVSIGVGEDGVLTGLIVNDTPASRRWAEREFQRLKADADPLTISDLPSE
jgi:predicted transcriptional regulator